MRSLVPADAGRAGLSHQMGDALAAYADPRLHQLRVDVWRTVGATTAPVEVARLPRPARSEHFPSATEPRLAGSQSKVVHL